MTKKYYIENSMIYTGYKNVNLCINYLEETLVNTISGDIRFVNSKIIEPSAGGGSFYDALKYYDITAYDMEPDPSFKKCIQANFLSIRSIQTNRKYKIFVGFPPMRTFINFIEHCFDLNADVIAFIMPLSSTNKKYTKIYKANGYELVFNRPVISKDFKLPDGSEWDMSANFVIIVKEEYIKKNISVTVNYKTFKDFFDVYTINTGIMTIRETSQPHLFKDGKIPKNRKTGKPYEILVDENGKKYYYQNGINLDKINECQVFIPLRVFPSKQEGFVFYDTFYDETFANIGFGLKIKDGYAIKKVSGNFIYYIYKELYPGVLVLEAKIASNIIEKFYATQRYNNGIFVSSKKLIENTKISIN